MVTNARRLAKAEGADWLVVMAAAWLHDSVIVAKSSPERGQASQLAAAQALTWLEKNAWPFGRLKEIAHAIEAHSFSAGIVPKTMEARVVQDADRLDAPGAVGLARTLMLGAEMKRDFYHPQDPFCESRERQMTPFTRWIIATASCSSWKTRCNRSPGERKRGDERSFCDSFYNRWEKKFPTGSAEICRILGRKNILNSQPPC